MFDTDDSIRDFMLTIMKILLQPYGQARGRPMTGPVKSLYDEDCRAKRREEGIKGSSLLSLSFRV